MPARHAAVFVSDTPVPKDVYNKQVYFTALVASMGAFIFGYDLAFIGTTITLEPFKRDFGLLNASEATSDGFSANIVSLLQAGCFFGSLAVAPLGDRYGRKISLIIAGILFCIGSLMQTVSYGLVAVMFVGRAIGGLVSISSSRSSQELTRSIERCPTHRVRGYRLTRLAGCWTRKRHCTDVRSRAVAAGHQRSSCRHLRD